MVKKAPIENMYGYNNLHAKVAHLMYEPPHLLMVHMFRIIKDEWVNNVR